MIMIQHDIMSMIYEEQVLSAYINIEMFSIESEEFDEVSLND